MRRCASVIINKGAQLANLTCSYRDQPLYELSLTVRGESEERRLCVDLGLRQARLVTKPDNAGESFYLEINGTFDLYTS
jgi:hypothetical protein